MDQRKATNAVTIFPALIVTKGQDAAIDYLVANTKAGPNEVYQLIFDAGLVRLFQAAAKMHAEYLEDVATATKENDDEQRA